MSTVDLTLEYTLSGRSKCHVKLYDDDGAVLICMPLVELSIFIYRQFVFQAH